MYVAARARVFYEGSFKILKTHFTLGIMSLPVLFFFITANIPAFCLWAWKFQSSAEPSFPFSALLLIMCLNIFLYLSNNFPRNRDPIPAHLRHFMVACIVISRSKNRNETRYK